jgi:TPR repeat protein
MLEVDQTSSVDKEEAPAMPEIFAGHTIEKPSVNETLWKYIDPKHVAIAAVVAIVIAVGLWLTFRDPYPDLTDAGLIQFGQKANDIDHDYYKALSYFEDACQRRNVDGCYNVGVLYLNGNGVGRNYKKAAKMFAAACDLGSHLGCNRLGWAYMNGDGVSKDLSKAWDILHKECNLSNLHACASADDIVKDNPQLPPYVTAESQAAQKVATDRGDDACRAYLRDFRHGSRYALCQKKLGAEAEFHFLKGSKAYAESRLSDAEDELNAACLEGEGIGCKALGDKYLIQSEVAKNPQAWNPYRVCGPGTGLDCMEGMMFFGSLRPAPGLIMYDAAVTLYTWGCDEGSSYGCLALSKMYADGEGVSSDASKASDFRQRGLAARDNACSEGHRFECRLTASLYFLGKEVPQDYQKSASLYEQGCNAGDSEACAGLGSQYWNGLGVAKHFETAAKWFVRGCDGRSALSCAALGDAYYTGQGVAKDVKRAFDLYQAACQGGNANACKVLTQQKLSELNGGPVVTSTEP